MATKDPQTPTKRLWQILQAVYYLLYKGVSKQWLSLDFHLLSKRGRLAAKSLKRLTDHHPSTHPAKHYMSVLTCRSMDPATAVYVPREVEFSCSNTPSFPSLYNVSKPKLFRKNHKRSLRSSYSNDDVSSVTRIFEVLDMGEPEEEVDSVASPSPWINWKTPVGVRQLRVTDSPYMTEEEGEKEAKGVDMEAEEFIAWFREQLRSQHEHRYSRYY
ncbi:Avr9/Cf-9 rapidly elicited protein [Rhynchospora pubera]|uniref:Avr9/Cf-9 rapidly elicited protein n=1 Tax=Rhynchospora pubera TaxID=906938 RepID=A0AAV8G2L5_9POAL|nr:Avr9/Cf-9 rapidly elicited protein [Rhynchospora pubera]